MATFLRVFPCRERIADELDAALCNSSVALGGELYALDEFVDLLSPVRAMDAAQERALWGRCLASVDLGPLAQVARRPGFVESAVELIASLKAGRCWAPQFADAVCKFPEARADRAQALSRLYNAYEQRLSDCGLADAHDALAAAIRRVNDFNQPLPVALTSSLGVIFEDIYDWFPLRLELLLALARRFDAEKEGRQLQLLLPHDHQRPELMALVDPAWEKIFQSAQQCHALQVFPKEYGDRQSGPALLASQLFRQTAGGWDSPAVGALVCAADERQEAREVALRVRKLLDAGALPSSVVVAVREIDRETQRLVETLVSHGVPVKARQGPMLVESSVATLAPLVATMRHDDFPWTTLQALFSSGGTRLDKADAARVLETLRYLGVESDRDRQGANAYARALEKLAASQEPRAASLTQEALQMVFAAANQLPRERAPMAAHARGLVACLTQLGALRALEPSDATEPKAVKERAESAKNGVITTAKSEFGPLSPKSSGPIPISMAPSASALAREQDAARCLVSVIDGLQAAFATAGRAEELIDAAAFASCLVQAMAEVFLPAQTSLVEAVRVVRVQELVGRSVEHLFLVGLVDGKFPLAPQSQFLFTEEDRLSLNAILRQPVFRVNANLDGPFPGRQAEEPLLFHLAFCSARASVTLSWSRGDCRGRQHAASRFVEEVRKIPGALVDEYRPSAILPSGAQACRPADLLARVALELKAPRAFRISPIDGAFDARGSWERLGSQDSRRLRSVEARIAAEQERFVFFSNSGVHPGAYSGLLGEAAAELAPRLAFDERRPLSPKTLSELGTCRFKGWAGLVLGLRVEPEPSIDPQVTTVGELQHRALHALLLERKKKGRVSLAVDGSDRAALRQELLKAAAQLEKERLVGHPELWILAVEECEQRLWRVLTSEAGGFLGEGEIDTASSRDSSSNESAFELGASMRPELFEAVLGQGPLPLLQIRAANGELVQITGRIDRVDAGKDGAMAIDYKSARADKLVARIKEGFLESEFQLAVYAAALQVAWGRKVDAAFISLSDAQSVRLSQVLGSMGIDLQEALAVEEHDPRQSGVVESDAPTLASAVLDLVRQARAGSFPARSTSCDHCDFRALCRVGITSEMPRPADE